MSARIVPYLVAILTAVAMFRASGALDFLIGLINPLTNPLGVPPPLPASENFTKTRAQGRAALGRYSLGSGPINFWDSHAH